MLESAFRRGSRCAADMRVHRGGRGGAGGPGLARWERALEALVRLLVAERPVEPVGGRASLVGRELGERAASRDAPRVRPRHHRTTDALAPQPPVDTDGLDQQPRRAAAGDPGDHGELHGAHDLAVARLLSDRMVVMKDGRVVEEGLTDRLLDDPQAPYTQLLVASILQV